MEFGSPSGLVGEYHFTPLGPLGNPSLIVATAFDLGTLTPETAYTATSGRLVISKDDVSGLWTINIENAHLMNLEHNRIAPLCRSFVRPRKLNVSHLKILSAGRADLFFLLFYSLLSIPFRNMKKQ